MCKTCTRYCDKHQDCGGDAFDESCKFVMNPYDEYGVRKIVEVSVDGAIIIGFSRIKDVG